MRRLLGIVISAGVLGSGGLWAAAPAKADCIRAEVIVYWSDGTQQTVWPSSHCFADTGYDVTWPSVTARDEDDNIPPGYPEGAKVQVWVPLP